MEYNQRQIFLPGITTSQFKILQAPIKILSHKSNLQAGNLYIALASLINLTYRKTGKKGAVFRKRDLTMYSDLYKT